MAVSFFALALTASASALPSESVKPPSIRMASRAGDQDRGAEESMLAGGKMLPGQLGICSHGGFHS
jgi:hypothetical protein